MPSPSPCPILHLGGQCPSEKTLVSQKGVPPTTSALTHLRMKASQHHLPEPHLPPPLSSLPQWIPLPTLSPPLILSESLSLLEPLCPTAPLFMSPSPPAEPPLTTPTCLSWALAPNGGFMSPWSPAVLTKPPSLTSTSFTKPHKSPSFPALCLLRST